MIKIYFAIFFCVFRLAMLGQEVADKYMCKITSLSIDKNGILHWTTKGETSMKTFVIEEFRWKKWIKIGEIYSKGTPHETTYNFHLIQHTGTNEVRVRQQDVQSVSKKIQFNSTIPIVNYKIEETKKEIIFSDKTLFEIIDSLGTIIRKGYSNSVSVEKLSEGLYILNYDNSTIQFRL